ncbi:uncharacterized protein LOC119661351 isoform X2 [Hermetia illucens]|uniref:uncharacterized protein LOC119661351 isoform X2 n=1 Tax=Hermetia illucens TaxID=343691 RepID=UPI0018CC3465|nr:uncharacterized protein LOC119661351 isoform X2 [Hermetia illucens]
MAPAGKHSAKWDDLRSESECTEYTDSAPNRAYGDKSQDPLPKQPPMPHSMETHRAKMNQKAGHKMHLRPAELTETMVCVLARLYRFMFSIMLEGNTTCPFCRERENTKKEGKKNDESKTEKDKEVEEKGKKEPEKQSSEHMVQHYKEDISKMARKNDPVANIRQINNIITRDHQRKDILKKNEEKKQDICDEKKHEKIKPVPISYSKRKDLQDKPNETIEHAVRCRFCQAFENIRDKRDTPIKYLGDSHQKHRKSATSGYVRKVVEDSGTSVDDEFNIKETVAVVRKNDKIKPQPISYTDRKRSENQAFNKVNPESRCRFCESVSNLNQGKDPGKVHSDLLNKDKISRQDEDVRKRTQDLQSVSEDENSTTKHNFEKDLVKPVNYSKSNKLEGAQPISHCHFCDSSDDVKSRKETGSAFVQPVNQKHKVCSNQSSVGQLLKSDNDSDAFVPYKESLMNVELLSVRESMYESRTGQQSHQDMKKKMGSNERKRYLSGQEQFPCTLNVNEGVDKNFMKRDFAAEQLEKKTLRTFSRAQLEQIKNVSPTRAAFNKNEKPMKAKLAGDGANPDTDASRCFAGAAVYESELLPVGYDEVCEEYLGTSVQNNYFSYQTTRGNFLDYQPKGCFYNENIYGHDFQAKSFGSYNWS